MFLQQQMWRKAKTIHDCLTIAWKTFFVESLCGVYGVREVSNGEDFIFKLVHLHANNVNIIIKNEEKIVMYVVCVCLFQRGDTYAAV